MPVLSYPSCHVCRYPENSLYSVHRVFTALKPYWFCDRVAETTCVILLSIILSKIFSIPSNRDIGWKELGSDTGFGDPLCSRITLAFSHWAGKVVVRKQEFMVFNIRAGNHLATTAITSLTIPSGPGDLPDGSLLAITVSSSLMKNSGSPPESDQSGSAVQSGRGDSRKQPVDYQPFSANRLGL